MIVLAVLILLLAPCADAAAQRVPYRVHLRDKGPGEFRPGTPLYDSIAREYHPQALSRRSTAGMAPVLDSLDRPLHGPYVEQIRAISDSVLTSNPWFNYIVVGLDSNQLQRARQLDFVRSVSPCRSVSYVLGQPEDCTPPPDELSTPMLEVGNVNRMHDLGVYGQGARIGVIDNGFRWRSMRALGHLSVEKEYDFIYRRPVTSNQDNDPGAQDHHGSLIMSVAAAWHTDSVMGVAPFATYLLAKTEDMRYERRIEEDLYVEALWWLEKNGVDISSSSLGYRTFDSTDESTPYELLDGRTTFPARAINVATSRGMICVTAAGNEGPKGRSISTPGDADSAVTVGAISLDGTTAWPASSWGPTASGRQKPDFSAPGMRVPSQFVDGSIIRASGTSLATPFVAAQFGLLRQLYPALPASIIRDAMRRASVYADAPDSVLGHGAVDIVTAACLLGPKITEPAVVTVEGKTVILAPIFSTDVLEPELQMSSPDSTRSTVIIGRRIVGQFYMFELDERVFDAGKARYRIIAMQKGGSMDVYPPVGHADVTQRGVSVPCGMRLPSVLVSVADDRPRHSLPVVTGAPLATGARELAVTGLVQAPYRLRLIHIVTGQVIEADLLGHDERRTSVMAPSGLTSGAWILECRTPDALVHLPFVVI